MRKLLIIGAAAGVASMSALEGAVRVPAAYQDSEESTIDTRVGTASASSADALDSRVGSLADSLPGRLDTLHNPSLRIIIR
jgi:hypothetical protein